MTQYKVIFAGIILPGHDVNIVTQDIKRTLKLTDEQCINFFSGKPITIKEDIALEQAHAIKTALENKGLLINLEEISIEATKETTKPQRQQLKSIKPAHNTQHNNKVYLGEEDAPSFFNFSFDGRYGRLNFINAVWAIYGMTFLAAFITSLIGGFLQSEALTIILVIIIVILMQYFYMRAIALRFHDLDQSGWLCLLSLISFIPFAGGLFALGFTIFLMAAAGTKGDNKFGAQPEKGHIIGLILTCIAPVALIAILITFAVPAYNDYTKRTYAAEGIALASAPKMAIAEYYREHKKLPATNRAAGLPAPNTIMSGAVSSIEINHGNITVQYNGKLDYGTIILTPEIFGGSIQWQCTQGTLKSSYRPISCRNSP